MCTNSRTIFLYARGHRVVLSVSHSYKDELRQDHVPPPGGLHGKVKIIVCSREWEDYFQQKTDIIEGSTCIRSQTPGICETNF
jgi:hypothetical protein